MEQLDVSKLYIKNNWWVSYPFKLIKRDSKGIYNGTKHFYFHFSVNYHFNVLLLNKSIYMKKKIFDAVNNVIDQNASDQV